ncbi:hypothetical protein [Alteraurantiacibacter buctensis]|uniref:Lipoprotein n=1 Tax=Alteraurantiacibacter buctensis TaxID=1503981 RepID=A0A844YV41_9SPHN|nr:hypothetical protein [Alteraurantiacibacter buctensis]MXO70711.1 hypothetical protein [Alteraurantiacibacter buctensis]
MLKNRPTASLGGLVFLLMLSGCIQTDQQRSASCESGVAGDIFVNSRYCDNVERWCDGLNYAHQNILFLNRTDVAAAVRISYSDGSSEERLIPAHDSYHVIKSLGTGAEVVAQC